jgi:DNA-binding GntR family transcriptional regulator
MDFGGVSKRGDTHLYLQIAKVIQDAIASGELHSRDPVPSEQRIMDETGVSRWAVRHAIAYLREQGTVYTVPQLGSFVSGP